jgi:glutamyl-tRNA synthetase
MVVTRFAPSPTGYLHIGGLRTALFSWLWAKKNNGKFLLRIEDTDMARNSEDATKAILEAFDWVGMSYDGEALYQSKRFDIYKGYVKQLLDEGKAYYCYMTKEELDALREEQKANGQKQGYDGRYRDGKLPARADAAPSVRIKAPLEGEISFDDGVKGTITTKAADLDDFVIARSDGSPTYNFCVAIDDALMGVTDVIRGDDHTSNTPRQVVVYNSLGFDVPRFCHVPMILGSDGKKLSKRDGAADVMDYKRLGYMPEALLNFLVRLGWSHGDKELFSLEEMLELFDPANINSSASQYNLDKLNWISGEHIKKASLEKIEELLKDFECDLGALADKELAVKAISERAKTIKELADGLNTLALAPSSYDEKAVEKNINPAAKEMLSSFATALENSNAVTLEELKSFIDGFVADKGIKMPQLGMPLRIAVVGSTQSPSINELIKIVGLSESVKRIRAFLAKDL